MIKFHSQKFYKPFAFQNISSDDMLVYKGVLHGKISKILLHLIKMYAYAMYKFIKNLVLSYNYQLVTTYKTFYVFCRRGHVLS